MAEEQTDQPTPQNSPIRTDFLSRAAIAARDGFATFRSLEALANDYLDLGYAPGGETSIVQADAAGTLDGLNPMDVLTAIQGIAAIGQALDANDGQLRKAFKRLAAYAR